VNRRDRDKYGGDYWKRTGIFATISLQVREFSSKSTSEA
jgi:hypothetical protein